MLVVETVAGLPVVESVGGGVLMVDIVEIVVDVAWVSGGGVGVSEGVGVSVVSSNGKPISASSLEACTLAAISISPPE